MRAQLLPLYVPGLLFSAAWAALQLTVPLLSLQLGASAAQTGIILALFELGSLAAGVPAGAFVARVSPRFSCALSTLLLAVMIAMGGLSRGLLELSLAVFAMGVARGVWEVSRLAYARYASQAAERGRVLAALGGVHRLGSVIGPGAAGLIAAAGGLSLTMLVISGAMLAVAGATGALMSNTGMASRDRDSERAGSFGSIVRAHWRILLRNGAPTMILMLVRTSRRLLLPVWGEHLQLDTDAIGYAVSVTWGVDVAVVYAGGAVSDRFGRRVASSTALVVMSLGLLLLPFATSYPLYLLVAALMGIGNGFSAGAVMTMGADMAPRGQSGRFLGVWRFLSDVGAASGPLVIGGAAQLLSLAAAGPATGAIGLLGAVLFLFVARETDSRRAPGDQLPPTGGSAGSTSSGNPRP